jgi:hypothetical protein
VRQVFARHLDQVGNQVVAALELHVDLPEGVGNRVLQPRQAVEGANGPEQHHQGHTSKTQVTGDIEHSFMEAGTLRRRGQYSPARPTRETPKKTPPA